MLGVLIIFTAAAIGVAVLYYAIREWGEVEASVWQPISMLVAGRMVGRLFQAILPDMDSFTRMGIGMLLYILVIGGMLTFWTKVPPIRSLLLAIGLAFFMVIAGLIAVAYMPAE